MMDITETFLVSLVSGDVLRNISFKYLMDFLKKEKRLK
jgi:hypothetical protein